MLYGIKMDSAIFQRTIKQVIVDDMENIVCYQDDVCIGDRNEILLKRLRNAGMKVSKKKMCIQQW